MVSASQPPDSPSQDSLDYAQLATDIKLWGIELGFDDIAITDTQLDGYTPRLQDWLAQHYHGEMGYMARHAKLRSHPQQLLPDVKRVICARINYLPPSSDIKDNLRDKQRAYVSRYAVGRDYHKLIRRRLAQLANRIATVTGDFKQRAFADSAPVLEKPLAEKAGLGWIGKHTNLINAKAGSWFFLGVLYTDLPLPCDTPQAHSHCGSCSACIDICPTQAIVGPYQLDARRCISYLTIELKGTIPTEFRPLLGNRIYGCDDCQLVCPWNRFAKVTATQDFHPRHNLDKSQLIELFAWDEAEFLKKTEGSAIRRIGHERWLRNIAVALGNAPTCTKIIAALQSRQEHPSALVREHVAWALAQHEQ